MKAKTNIFFLALVTLLLGVASQEQCPATFGSGAKCEDNVDSVCGRGKLLGFNAAGFCDGGADRRCCMHFKMTNAFKFFNARNDWQVQALNNLQSVIRHKGYYRTFSCQYRNQEPDGSWCGTEISMSNSAQYYSEDIAHQVTALDNLQTAIENDASLTTNKDNFWFNFIITYRNVGGNSGGGGNTGGGSSCERRAATHWNSISTNGLNLLTHFEGFSSRCYKDTEGIWTIGYGHACHVNHNDGSGCLSGNNCDRNFFLSREKGKEILAKDLAKFSKCVRDYVKVPVTRNQFDSMVSFALNVGCGGFSQSTFLRKLNAGQLSPREAQYQLSRWHSGCTAGLMRRRFAEAALFNSCEENFPCTDTSCSLSYNYERCRDSCEYCGRCITCSSSSHSPSRLEAEEETVAFNETIKFCNETTFSSEPCFDEEDDDPEWNCDESHSNDVSILTECPQNPKKPRIKNVCQGIEHHHVEDLVFETWEPSLLKMITTNITGAHLKVQFKRGWSGYTTTIRLHTYVDDEAYLPLATNYSLESTEASDSSMLITGTVYFKGSQELEPVHEPESDSESESKDETGITGGITSHKTHWGSAIAAATAVQMGWAVANGEQVGLRHLWPLGLAAPGVMARTLRSSCVPRIEMVVTLSPNLYDITVEAIKNNPVTIFADEVEYVDEAGVPNEYDCRDPAVNSEYTSVCAGIEMRLPPEEAIGSDDDSIPVSAVSSHPPMTFSNALIYYKDLPHQKCAFDVLQRHVENTDEFRVLRCEYRNQSPANGAQCTTNVVFRLSNVAQYYDPDKSPHQLTAVQKFQRYLEQSHASRWATFTQHYRNQLGCIDLVGHACSANHPLTNQPGICVDQTQCANKGGETVTGLCPNDPASVRCCAKSTDQNSGGNTGGGGSADLEGDQCVTNHPTTRRPGVCISRQACQSKGGTTQSGLCPGHAADILCCDKQGASIKYNSHSDLCGTYAGNPVMRIPGNSLTYTVTKVQRNHLTTPSFFDDSPLSRDNTVSVESPCFCFANHVFFVKMEVKTADRKSVV